MRFDVIPESSPDKHVAPVDFGVVDHGAKLPEIAAAELQCREANPLG
jgi:hypothetical protein